MRRSCSWAITDTNTRSRLKMEPNKG
jgi:hypothetical protein